MRQTEQIELSGVVDFFLRHRLIDFNVETSTSASRPAIAKALLAGQRQALAHRRKLLRGFRSVHVEAFAHPDTRLFHLSQSGLQAVMCRRRFEGIKVRRHTQLEGTLV